MHDDAWHSPEDYPPPTSHRASSFERWEQEMKHMLGPPWTSFDTFIRRVLMIGGAALVWAVVVAFAIIAIKGHL